MRSKELVLTKDIVIPKGTVFKTSPNKTTYYCNDFYETIIGLTNNTFGTLNYCVDNKEELADWFKEKEGLQVE